MRRNRLWLWFLAIWMVALGAVTGSVVGTPGAVGAPAQVGVEQTQAGLAAYRANRAAAEHEAGHLLSLARLKPGARRRRSVPQWYPKAELPYRVTGGLTVVELAAYWSVPVGGASGGRLPWYRPAGLSLNGTGTGSGPGDILSTSDDYWAAATRQWQSAELSFTELDNDNTAAIVQVLATVTWLDPRPLLDDAVGPRVHINIGKPCPSNLDDVVGASNPPAYRHVLLTRLAPLGPALAGQLCVYDVEGQHDPLYRTVHLPAPALYRWVTKASSLPLSHPDGVLSACALGFPAEVLLAFRYPRFGDGSIDLWLDLGGCATVANGQVTAAAGDLITLAHPYVPRYA